MFRLLENPKLITRTLLCTVLLTGSLPAQPFSTEKHASDQGGKTVKTWVVINNGATDGLKPGSDAQTVEAVKTFAQRCPAVGVTVDRNKADFTVLVGHDSHRPSWRRRNKLALFDRNGSLIFSTSTRSMGNAVKDACQAITKNSAELRSSSAVDDNRTE